MTTDGGDFEIRRDENRLRLSPGTGGAVLEWTMGGRAVFVPVTDANLRAQRGRAVAAYPLVPYSNRIAGGRFSFEGEDYQLDNNFGGEPHSIHGNAWEREWTVAHRMEDQAVLILDHVPDEGTRGQWPFAYRVALSYVLLDDGLEVEIVVENRDTRSQPVGFGFHPFIAADEETLLSFRARGVWENGADHLPSRHVGCEGAWAFEAPVRVKERSIDNCFSGFGGEARVEWPGDGVALVLEADPVFHHAVVFTAPDKPFVAVEAVTNMNDAIHHADIPDRGLHVLAPQQRIQGKIRYRLVDVHG